MSEGSVLAHVTEANDEADKGDAPLGEQNGALPRTPPKGLSPFGIPQYFCRSVDADPRKQGESEGSVLTHMTDANDAADEGDAPLNAKIILRPSARKP